jgi:signal peptidase
MKPTINDGDLAIATSVKPEDIRPDDIITYWTVINGERVLNTHRVVNIYDGGGFLIFETKGDANTVVDTLTVHEREIVGKYQFRIPGLGKVFDYLQTGVGFFIVVVIPVFIFFIYHLVQFFRVLFEYQNVKNRIKFEQERDEAEAVAAKENEELTKQKERAALEEEIRAQLRAEMLAEMAAKGEISNSGADSSENTSDNA